MDRSGHHGFTPLLVKLAKKYCEMTVVDHMTIHKEGITQVLANLDTVSRSKHLPFTGHYLNMHTHVKNLVHIDEESLPTGMGWRYRLTHNFTIKYNVGNIARFFSGNPNVTVKYIHLHRNFYKTVRSHYKFDGGFYNHALLLAKYAQFIQSEYDKSSSHDRSLWTRVRYEWLYKMNEGEFTAFIEKLIIFLDWKDCKNINFAALRGIIRQPRDVAVNKSEYEFASSLDTAFNIPYLMNLSHGDDLDVT